MKFKFKFRWAYLIYIAALILVILFTAVVCDNIKLNNYMKNEMHFESWELVYNNPMSFVLSKKAKSSEILFFDVMAKHEADSKNQMPDNWALPDFKGWSCAEVACALKNIGQEYEVRFMDAPSMQNNAVVTHEPAPGMSVSKDDVIILYANSSYGKKTSTNRIPIDTGVYRECGEWIVFQRDKHIYKSHIDFSDIEIIYTLQSEHTYFPVSMLTNKNQLYFTTSIRTQDMKEYYIIKLSIENKESELICTDEDWIALSYYYNDKMYLANNRDTYKYINLEDMTIIERSCPKNNTIYNDKLYWFDITEEDSDFSSKLYSKDYASNNAEAELLHIDGKIASLDFIENSIFIGLESADDKDMIYRYHLDTGKLEQIVEGNYNLISGYISMHCISFDNDVYIVDVNYYDYKYDLTKNKRYPITIVRAHDFSNAGSDFSICGNYMQDPCYFIDYSYFYNMMTQEYDYIDELESLKD